MLRMLGHVKDGGTGRPGVGKVQPQGKQQLNEGGRVLGGPKEMLTPLLGGWK